MSLTVAQIDGLIEYYELAFTDRRPDTLAALRLARKAQRAIDVHREHVAAADGEAAIAAIVALDALLSDDEDTP